MRLQWRTLDVVRVRSVTRDLGDLLERPDLLDPFEDALRKARPAFVSLTFTRRRADTQGGRTAIVRNTFLVTYDICQDKRLAKVHKTMRGFGDHLQYSVFECQLTRADLARCRHLLSTIIDHREDQVLFVDLGPTEGRGDRVITALGKPYSPIDGPCIIVDGRTKD